MSTNRRWRGCCPHTVGSIFSRGHFLFASRNLNSSQLVTQASLSSIQLAGIVWVFGGIGDWGVPRSWAATSRRRTRAGRRPWWTEWQQTPTSPARGETCRGRELLGWGRRRMCGTGSWWGWRGLLARAEVWWSTDGRRKHDRHRTWSKFSHWVSRHCRRFIAKGCGWLGLWRWSNDGVEWIGLVNTLWRCDTTGWKPPFTPLFEHLPNLKTNTAKLINNQLQRSNFWYWWEWIKLFLNLVKVKAWL